MVLRLRVALALSACGTAEQGDEAPAGSAASVISLDTLKGITQRLSSDEFEGREPGTPGEAKTLALLVERFQAAGLKPGNNGSWFQDVPLVELTARNVTPLTFTGGAKPLSFAYGPQMVVGSYRVAPRIDVRTATSSSSATASTRPSAAGTIMPASTCAARPSSSGQRSRLGDEDAGRPVRRARDDLLWPLDVQI
jgi:hypothetical protein